MVVIISLILFPLGQLFAQGGVFSTNTGRSDEVSKDEPPALDPRNPPRPFFFFFTSFAI
jgi:hypothetical protein